MKNTITLLVLVLLFNCSSDDSQDNNDLNQENLISATWFVNEVINENSNSPNLSDCDRMDMRRFDSDGRFLFNFHVETNSIPCFVASEEAGSWEVNDNILTIIYDEFDPNGPNEMDFEIISVTSSELRLSFFNQSISTNTELVYIK